MNDTFTLTGEGPAYKKEEPSIWKPPSQASINRQIIHSVLQKDITAFLSIDELQKATGLKRTLVYAACRMLAKKGFAVRKDSMEVTINPLKPEAECRKRIIRVRGVDLMGKLEKGSW